MTILYYIVNTIIHSRGMTNMKIKKILCVALSAVVSSLVILSGCNSGTSQNSTVSQFSTQSQQSVENSEKSDESSTELFEVSKEESTVEQSEESSKNETSENESSSSEEQITPAMWKVTSADGTKNIYMMGSIHVADKSVNDMPDYFEKIYAKSDALAFECDIVEYQNNALSDISSVKNLMYLDGTTIKDHISEDIYEKAVEILEENNIYNSMYDYCIPVMWTSLMDTVCCKKSGLDESYGVDMVMLKRAKTDKKEILEVESVEFQMNMLSGFSEELQEMLLMSYIQDGAIEEQSKLLNELYEKWKSGTITEEDVVESSDDLSEMTDEEKKLIEEYNKAMMTDRNIGMADKAEEYMNGDDTVLFIVGAAHFYGDDGILSLMESRGYTVTKITSESVSDTIQAAA